MTPETRLAAIRSGDRRALARAITLAESTRSDHRRETQALLDALGPASDATFRVGITGTPGVGKSTFIESFGLLLTRDLGLRLAVLAVDPSSSRSGGSILGDKTRMSELNREPNAFIRPSPASGTLGGVARRTREAIRLCEAAAFDVVLVETVGVGQSETAVAQTTDAFVLLVGPGGGDELQGVKRGIMELADLVVVNKCDGDLAPFATATASDYASALRLVRPRTKTWTPEVSLASAVTGDGVARVWDALKRYRVATEQERDHRRADQNVAWLWDEVTGEVLSRLHRDPMAAGLEVAVAAGTLGPAVAAQRLLANLRGPHTPATLVTLAAQADTDDILGSRRRSDA